MRWITVARFSMLHEAHLARARLESEGVDVLLPDEHTLTLQQFYVDALGGLRLQVPEADCERAEAILREDRSNLLHEEETLGGKRQCVRCGSPDLRSVIQAGPLVLVRALLQPEGEGLWRREWHCQACGMVMPDDPAEPEH
ncbi:DUF2007 domain-containing protein [Marinobacteraceae bacterium S3BR75-40.1]